MSHLSYRLGYKHLSTWLCALPPAGLPHTPSSYPVPAEGAGVPRAWSSAFWAHSMHPRCVVFKYKVLCPMTTFRSLRPAQTPAVSGRHKLSMVSCLLAPSRANSPLSKVHLCPPRVPLRPVPPARGPVPKPGTWETPGPSPASDPGCDRAYPCYLLIVTSSLSSDAGLHHCSDAVRCQEYSLAIGLGKLR